MACSRKSGQLVRVACLSMAIANDGGVKVVTALLAGTGKDTLIGGNGNDVLIMESGDTRGAGSGADTH